MEYGQRKAHPTKKGPGRRHGEGVKHGVAPKPSKGAWSGLHVASAAKKGRRAAIKAAGGVRKFKRQRTVARSA